MTAQSPGQRIAVRRMLHTIHAVRHIDLARKLYQDVFGGIAFAERYHEGEDRDMALLYVADHMVEPMAPRWPHDADTTFARYLARFGESLHSFELRIDDAVAAAALCRDRGYALASVYPTFFFVRPESTGGILVQLCGKALVNDPKDYRGWRDDWIAGHPGGLVRLHHIACVVRDVAPPLTFFREVLDGQVIDDAPIDAVQPARQVRVRLGDTNVALVIPDEPHNGALGNYLAGPASGIYALVWEVEDLKHARAHIEGLGKPIVPAHLSAEGFAIAPHAMLGGRHEFVQAT